MVNDYKFTGFFKIEGASINRTTNRIAFGILYKDKLGKYWIYQSKSRKDN